MLNRENKVNYISRETVISSENLNNIQESVIKNSEDIEVINSQLDNIVNEIENKTNINDDLISTESVWSSSKTESMIQQIPQGPVGPQGTQGPKGEDGITPNIQIGTVTTLESNQQATVENVGTKENPIFNFGIPRGQDGGSGEGFSEEKKLISIIELTEPANAIKITQDLNEIPLSELNLKSISMLAFASYENDGGGNACCTYINDVSVKMGQNASLTSSVQYYKMDFQLNKDCTGSVLFQTASSSTNQNTVAFGIPFVASTKKPVNFNTNKIESIKFSHISPSQNLAIGSKIILYGE